jgi:hypothetical protein
MRHVSRPYGPIYGPLIAAALLLAVPALAQTTVTDQSGSNSASTAGAAANNRNTNRLSNVGNQSATGAIAGNQVNAPISSRSGATATTSSGSTSNAQSGTSRVRVGGQTSSQSVRVVNVTGGGGSGGGTNGANGANAVDPAGPAGANGTNGANDPPAALGSAGNPLTENIGGTTTLRNTPEIVAPNISGGNPCLVGISGGGAGPGIGITFGVGYSDRGCERRNSAALLSNIGEKDVAIELMCDDDNVRQAMARSGHPCAADRAVATPVAQVDPAVVRRQQDAAVAQQVAAKPARPDWCQTASAQELRTHPQCD